MHDEQAKAAILKIGRVLYDKGMVAAHDGNISIKADDGNIWLTPTCTSKGFMREEDLLKLSPAGEVICCGPKPPSSEKVLHLTAYAQNPAIGAVIHAHPVHATAFALAGQTLDSSLVPELAVHIGDVPLAPFAPIGSPELAKAAEPFFTTHNSVLLARHGVLCWGKDIEEAWFRIEALEHCAKLLLTLRQLQS